MLPTAARYAATLAVLRICTGMFWLVHGSAKVMSATWATPDGDCFSIMKGMIEGTSGPYHDFMVNVALPNVVVFAHLDAWGETLVGISLALGLLTSIGGAGGVFLALNYFLAKGSPTHLDAYGGLDAAAITLSAIHLALPTGLVFGVDGVIAARKQRAPVPR